MDKKYSSLMHFNLYHHYLPTNKNPNIKYLVLLSSFIHQSPSLSKAAILKKTTTPHPLAILSTNWDLDIMKNKHQNHTASKLLLQTRCPHSPLSMNAKPTSIIQSKQAYTISSNT
jgi:hypothetical protein